MLNFHGTNKLKDLIKEMKEAQTAISEEKHEKRLRKEKYF